MQLTEMTRFQAFSGHFVISLMIALLTSSVVFLVWYPDQLATASGVSEIYWMLLGIDVVLGPVLTLIVFNSIKEKLELRRDLLIIVMLQLAALIYGLQAVWIARPVYVVFSVDRFDLVFANDFTTEKLAKVSNPEFQSLPLLGPKIIAARQPDDAEASKELLFDSISGGDDLPQLPQYYVPIWEQKTNILKNSQSLSELKKFNQTQPTAVDALLNQYNNAKIDAGFLPLKGKVKDLTVIINLQSGEVLDIIDLKPWL